MSDWNNSLTAKQETALKEFRQMVQDSLKPQHDDYFLQRWLRARQWDPKKAETMLKSSLAWREREGADNIVDNYDPPEVLSKYFPGGLCGYDKEGCPVWIESIGHADLKGLLHSASNSQLMKHRMYGMESISRELDNQSNKLEKKIIQAIFIFDMEQFGLKHLWKPGFDVLTKMATLVETNYPEIVKQVYIVKAPKIFPIAYNLMKPFLHEETKKKVRILGSDWKEKLLSAIDGGQLPVYWGGTKTDPDGDPYCKSQVCMAGDVPLSYYKKDTNPLDLGTMVQAIINKGSDLQVQCEVSQPNSIIRWTFQSDNHDIGFGIFKQTSKEKQKIDEMEIVVMSERGNSHMVPQDGAVSVQPGMYVVRFDNTYSWLTTKKIYYLINVLPPDDQIPQS